MSFDEGVIPSGVDMNAVRIAAPLCVTSLCEMTLCVMTGPVKCSRIGHTQAMDLNGASDADVVPAAAGMG
jgi:hypothetical protein